MSVTSTLVDFAKSSGAQVQLYRTSGIAITWDNGRNWQHIWDQNGTPPQAFYGESEYFEARVPTMISDHGEIMLKWAILRIGANARRAIHWPTIRIPHSAESVDPQWGFQQLTPITGTLTIDNSRLPFEQRTIFPFHYELNQLSHVITMDFEALLHAYMDPTGGELLSHWTE